MMKYKVGDTVHIRKDLEVGTMYGDLSYCLGKKARILGVCNYGYLLDIDNCKCKWTDKMFDDKIKTRGFEKISEKQFLKDFKDITQTVNYNDIQIPKRSTAKSAGYDCFAPIDIKLAPNEEIKLPTGIRSYMLNDEVLFAAPRSGHGFKYYLRLANTVGVIDSDYYESDNEGHIFVKLRNEGNKTLEIEKGKGMCQLIFQKYLLADGDDFTGEQRNGGFGSTDK